MRIIHWLLKTSDSFDTQLVKKNVILILDNAVNMSNASFTVFINL